MKTAKRIALVYSALGILITVQKYRHKKKRGAIRPGRLNKKDNAACIQPESVLKIYNLTEEQAKEKFKNTIAAGEDMSEQEYIAYMQVMRHEKKTNEITAERH